jgi:hypothetical protein
MFFKFLKISDNALIWIIFDNGILTSSLTSQKLITAVNFLIYFTATEICQHLCKKSLKISWKFAVKKLKFEFFILMFSNSHVLYYEDSTIKKEILFISLSK